MTQLLSIKVLDIKLDIHCHFHTIFLMAEEWGGNEDLEIV